MHGVIWDFINKVRINSKRLEVLGDGTQTKSYIHVSDCIDCFFYCLSKNRRGVELFNLGNYDHTDVISIAKIVCKSMNLDDVEIFTSGGVDGGRGWIGDVKKMHLDMSKLKNFGWAPTHSSLESVKLASKELCRVEKYQIV